MPFPSVSIVAFEQVNVIWDEIHSRIHGLFEIKQFFNTLLSVYFLTFDKMFSFISIRDDFSMIFSFLQIFT